MTEAEWLQAVADQQVRDREANAVTRQRIAAADRLMEAAAAAGFVEAWSMPSPRGSA